MNQHSPKEDSNQIVDSEYQGEPIKPDEANTLAAKVSKQSNAKWINNQGEEVEEVFGFNENAELVNGRGAMVGFLMLVITEIIFSGQPVKKSIFGIG